MEKDLRVAAYCRVSTEKDDQINSLISQRKYFADYIEHHVDWSLGRIYYDEGISGTSVKKRTGFNTMIADAETGKIDLILTKEVSRFARNTVDTLSYTRELKNMGVGVLFMTDNIDTRDSDGELRLSIMASIAQEESRKTSMRVRWGQRRRMEQGIVFGRDLLGYTVKCGKLTVNPEEAPIVKLIFHKYLDEGKGTHVIARELREAGILPMRVKEWSNTVILRILRNEKYVGDLNQKKTYTPDYLTHAKKYNRGNEEAVYLKDHHEPIIDRETWDKTQAELKRRAPSEEQRSRHSNRYWCSGKLVCGVCGQRFVSRTKKLHNGQTYKAWRCYAAANHGQKKTDAMGNTVGCDSESVNDRVLRESIAFVIQHIQSDRESIKKEMLQEIKAVQSCDTKIDTAPLYAKINKLQEKKRKAIDLVLDGIISKQDLRQQNAAYDKEIGNISEQITQAENQNQLQKEQIKGVERYLEALDSMLNVDSDNEALYHELLNKIVISPGHLVTVYLNCVPFGIQLHYETSGRADNFKVIIDKFEVLN